MTFSLVARCSKTGMFGVAVASSSPAVAARCVYTRAGIGAVASQNVTDPRLGPIVLDLMQGGMSASEALAAVCGQASFSEYRQVLAIDKQGDTAIHSGARSLGIWAHASGVNVMSAGSLLANDKVPEAMVKGFEVAKGHLGERLISSLQAGLVAGGEAGPVRSSGLQLCDRVSWPVVDLRCDWHMDCPIENLSATWEIYKPQLEAYVQRALDPSRAPSYNVPGEQ